MIILLLLLILEFTVVSCYRIPLRTIPMRCCTLPSMREATVSETIKSELICDAKTFLNKMMSSRTSEDEKNNLMTNFQQIRSNQEIWINLIDKMVAEVNGIESNRIAMFKYYPFPLPSYRIKLGIMNRLVQVVLEKEDSELVDARSKQRRALSIVLGQLQNYRGIRALEKEASRRLVLTTMKEMLERTPQGLETPKYSTLYESKEWEVRSYKSFSVCSAPMEPSAQQGSGAFNSLAGYIFGKNSQQEKMAMTTPVISSSPLIEASSRKMSFIMPSKFWNLTEAVGMPSPLEGSGVAIESGGAGLTQSQAMAVLWFGGYATKNEVRARAAALIDAVSRDSNWALQNPQATEADVLLMQYNDPFQPPWKRRNEVALPVLERTSLS